MKTNEAKKIFSQRVKEERLEHGWTQEFLAYKVKKIGQSEISQYETGAAVPRLDTLIRIANVFRVSVGYLLGETDKRKPERK